MTVRKKLKKNFRRLRITLKRIQMLQLIRLQQKMMLQLNKLSSGFVKKDLFYHRQVQMVYYAKSVVNQFAQVSCAMIVKKKLQMVFRKRLKSQRLLLNQRGKRIIKIGCVSSITNKKKGPLISWYMYRPPIVRYKDFLTFGGMHIKKNWLGGFLCVFERCVLGESSVNKFS